MQETDVVVPISAEAEDILCIVTILCRQTVTASYYYIDNKFLKFMMLLNKSTIICKFSETDSF